MGFHLITTTTAGAVLRQHNFFINKPITIHPFTFYLHNMNFKPCSDEEFPLKPFNPLLNSSFLL